MTIALIAHDSKKELMVQFCTAYCRILSQHKLVATGTTGKLISEATGLQVQRFLAGVQGGERKRASCGCNRRRRLATGSRQPKRGFGTAVPKTTIEVAERRLSALCRSTFPTNQLKGAQHRGRGQP